MISVENIHVDKRCTASSASNLSSLSGRDIKYKQPVYFIPDKNLEAQFENDRKDSQICKLDKIEKPHFMAIPDRRVIDRSTFKRLKNKAVVVTAEDRRKKVEGLMADRERLESESTARKQKLQSYDVLRTKGKQLAQVSVTYIIHILYTYTYETLLIIILINMVFKQTINSIKGQSLLVI